MWHEDARGDHWDHAQLVWWRRAAASAARRRRRHDKKPSRATDAFAVEPAARLHLLGIDPDQFVTATNGRPMKLIAEDVPVIKEAIL